MKKETPYFVYDPDGDGFTYFATEEERDRFSEECIKSYLDDSWDEGVTRVIGGKITHRAAEVDRVDRPPEVDEEGCDHEGHYWPQDAEYMCGYKLLPIDA